MECISSLTYFSSKLWADEEFKFSKYWLQKKFPIICIGYNLRLCALRQCGNKLSFVLQINNNWNPRNSILYWYWLLKWRSCWMNIELVLILAKIFEIKCFFGKRFPPSQFLIKLGLFLISIYPVTFWEFTGAMFSSVKNSHSYYIVIIKFISVKQ